MTESNGVAKHYNFNQKFSSVGSSTVWTELTALTKECNAVDLGQV